MRDVEKRTFAEIAAIVGGSVASVHAALRSPEEHAQYLAHVRSRRPAAQKLPPRTYLTICEIDGHQPDPPIPPKPQWRPHTSLTAILMGDPAVNRSALAQRSSNSERTQVAG
jgi:hypothetical protein